MQSSLYPFQVCCYSHKYLKLMNTIDVVLVTERQWISAGFYSNITAACTWKHSYWIMHSYTTIALINTVLHGYQTILSAISGGISESMIVTGGQAWIFTGKRLHLSLQQWSKRSALSVELCFVTEMSHKDKSCCEPKWLMTYTQWCTEKWNRHIYTGWVKKVSCWF